jgi:hypothetical protein
MSDAWKLYKRWAQLWLLSLLVGLAYAETPVQADEFQIAAQR